MALRLAACFGLAASESPSTGAGPSFTTSIYETRRGPAALTWSRAAFGLALRAEIRLSDDEHFTFSIRPSFLWGRRGSRRFRVRDRRRVDFAWDLSRAVFSSGRSVRPEPAGGFFVAVAVDGVMLVVAGDLVEEAYRKTRARRPKAPFLLPPLAARRELAAVEDLGGRGTYHTVALCGRREREISIDLGAKEGGRDSRMSVAVDGEQVFHVRCLQWKFRGNERLEIEGGTWMQVSWDLHDWLFKSKASPSSDAAAARVCAVFLFRFEDDVSPNSSVKDLSFDEDSRNGIHKVPAFEETETNTGYGAADRVATPPRWRQHRSRSSSSASSASTASSSTVTGWSSLEELELQKPEGFSLLVHIFKC
ncbi:uncharacterized protein LOC122037461 [Zingiber officinale]|uniref:DUF868 family protein n=1 Tax=Zingiber officinale TaxID=94328 RepID=A0A8J5BZK9_ZINOF|nr:uncharacterized protein LOC122037461 [Zingiber officinale]KAG6466101.1 hypothetical protein ZIOFF_076102 [Zingiber officinale]